jgi:hypothetical protein
MTRTPSRTTRSTLVAFGLAGVFAVSALFLGAQASPGANDHKAGQKLEGVWTIMITPTLPPGAPPLGPFTSYGSFARGGAFVGSPRSNELSFLANPQYGVWEHRGGNRYAFSFKSDLLDSEGKFSSVLTADSLITLSGNDSFVGVTNGEMHDADGNLILQLGCATMTGERMTIGPLADQCPPPALAP